MRSWTSSVGLLLSVLCRRRLEEIAEEFGFCRESGGYDHVHAHWNGKEYIATQPLRPRSIRILKMASEFYGECGDIFLVVAPEGTAKLTVSEEKRPQLALENKVIITS